MLTTFFLFQKCQTSDIQIWLGHSSYNTTANIYTHVDVESKQNSALVIGVVKTLLNLVKMMTKKMKKWSYK